MSRTPTVFITGAARGMGRAHAVRLARDGFDVAAADLCADIEGVPYPLSRPADLEETVALVEKEGRRAIALPVDVRDSTTLRAAVDRTVTELGGIDAAVFSAGIWSPCTETWSLAEDLWTTMIDVNLTGQWRSAAAVVPAMITSGGGSIVVVSSMNGLKASYGNGHYTSAKHGLIGLTKTLAIELAGHGIRVNAICPTGVKTPMLMNEALYGMFRPDLDAPTFADCEQGLSGLNLLPVAAVEPEDVSETVAFLVSPASKRLTGHALPVDAGQNVK